MIPNILDGQGQSMAVPITRTMRRQPRRIPSKQTTLSYRRPNCRELACEQLETRWLLAAPTIVETTPAPNDEAVAADSLLAVRFDQPLLPVSVHADSVRVHANQSVRLGGQPLDVQLSEDTVVITGAESSRAGEHIGVTVTDAIQNNDGQSTSPFVWQYRTAVGIGNGLGTGFLNDSGQRLGEGHSSAVAVGDLDGDGDLDAYVVNGRYRINAPDRVWLNNGDGTFIDSGQSLGNSSGAAVALGDLDGDGDLDALVGNTGYSPYNVNQVWLNDGAGQFTNSNQQLGAVRTTSVSLVDLDNDGDLDVFEGARDLVEPGPAYQIWLNHGDGTFEDGGRTFRAERLHDVSLGDLDGDGDVDAFLVQGNTKVRSFPEQVWLNDGSGVFHDSGQRLGEAANWRVSLGDVDGDGDLDAVGAGSRKFQVWRNSGDGTFAVDDQPADQGAVGIIELGDLDGDGDLDIFISDAIWLNDGTGRFSDSGQRLRPQDNARAAAVALGDLDGDGDLDAFAARRDMPANLVWLNADIGAELAVEITNDQIRATPGEPVTYRIAVSNVGPESLSGITVTDRLPDVLEDAQWRCEAGAGSLCQSSGTGDLSDVVTLAGNSEITYEITARLGPQAAELAEVRNAVTVVAPAGVQIIGESSISAEDVDHVIVAETTSISPRPNSHDAPSDTNVVATFQGEVDADSVSLNSFSVTGLQSGPLIGPAATVTAQGNSVVATSTRSFFPGELVEVTAASDIRLDDGQPIASPGVWRFRTAVGQGTGVGGGSLVHSSDLDQGNTNSVALADLDGDGDLDAFFANGVQRDGSPNTIWLNDGQGAFVPSAQSLGNEVSVDVSLGDLDGDADTDALVLNGDQTQIWLNQGQGTFEAGLLLDHALGKDLAIGDLDNDGDLDLFIGSRLDSVWLNDGRGNFLHTGQSFPETTTLSVELGDLDGDGDLDAMLVNKGEAHRVWLNDGFGRFEAEQSIDAPRASFFRLGDVDGDGDLDAVVGRHSFAPFHNEIWINGGNAVFTNSGQRFGNTRTSDLQLGDMDGDGDLDALTGNMRIIDDLLSGPPQTDPLPNELWLNDGTGAFKFNGQQLGNSLTKSIALGDIDGDGDLDAVEGNVQANSVWLNPGSGGANVQVSLSNGQETLKPGEPTQYIVTVTNVGPDDADMNVIVTLDPNLEGVSWRCKATLGSSCGSFEGVGSIDNRIAILSGGQVIYTLDGVIADSANSSIEVEAAVSLVGGVTELDPSDNRMVDRDVVGPRDVQPPPNSNQVDPESILRLEFHGQLDQATVSEETVTVHRQQQGALRPPNAQWSGEGAHVSIAPGVTFHAGELVSVTVSPRLLNADDQGSVSPYVMQYRVAVGEGHGAGSGAFEPSGPELRAGSPSLLADIDNDGILDAITSDGPWTNDGTGDFTLTGSADFSPNSTAIGDLDGDGYLDVLSNGHVWLNDRAGQLHDQGLRLAESEVQSIVLGDVDGDGDLDAVAGRRSFHYRFALDDYPSLGSAPVKVWLNDGSASFRDSGQELTSTYARSLQLGDLDADGDLDLVVGGSGRHPANTVLLNDGNGQFSLKQSLGESDTFAVELGDIDGDGDLDIMAANAKHTFPNDPNPRGSTDPAPNLVWINDGSANFSDSGQRLGDAITRDVDLGDIDGDGDLDALMSNSDLWIRNPVSPLLDRPFPDRSEVWMNDGHGLFTQITDDLGAEAWFGAALGDLDGDGDLDIFAGSDRRSEVWLNRNINPADLSVDLTSTFQVAQPGDHVQYVLVARNNGVTDVAGAELATAFSEMLSNLSWTCDASEGSSCSPQGVGSPMDQLSLLADGSATYRVTGTIKPDANTTLRSSAHINTPLGVIDYEPSDNSSLEVDTIPPVTVVAKPNSSTHVVSSPISFTSHQAIIPSSVDLDTLVVHGELSGRITMASVSTNPQDTVVMLSPSAPFHPGELVSVTATGSIENADGQGPISPHVWQFRTATGIGTGAGSGTLRMMGHIPGSQRERNIDLADLDGDGDLDVAGERNWINQGQAHFVESTFIRPSKGNVGALGDLDGDGDLDLIARTSDKSDNVWLNNGAGHFQQHPVRVGALFFGSMAAGDLDGDGDLDVLSDGTVWLNDGHADFAVGSTLDRAYGNITLGDLNADGHLDAVVGRQLWINEGAAEFTAVPSTPNDPWIDALGDLDGDGDLDIAANNAWERNNGRGSFMVVETFDGSYTSGVRLVDFDGDGDLDGFVLGRPNRILLNNGTGSLVDKSQDFGQTLIQDVAFGDLDGDRDVDALITRQEGEIEVWINEQQALPGDANRDGSFDQLDLVLVLQAGKYLTGEAASWEEGDWNRDGVFDGKDIAEALARYLSEGR